MFVIKQSAFEDDTGEGYIHSEIESQGWQPERKANNGRTRKSHRQTNGFSSRVCKGDF